MQLSDKQIEDFQNLHKKHTGQAITKEEAYEKGNKLIQLMRIIIKSITNNKN
jgi:hypothetical protein